MPVKFQCETIIITSNLTASRLHEIWRLVVNKGPMASTIYLGTCKNYGCQVPVKSRKYFNTEYPSGTYSNIARSRLHITDRSVAQSFWMFAQSTVVKLAYSVQNFKMTGQMKWVFLTHDISRDFSLRWVSEKHPTLHQPFDVIVLDKPLRSSPYWR